MQQLRLLSLFTLLFFGFSCERETEKQVTTHRVAFYTLAANQKNAGNESPVDSTQLIISETLLTDEDILAYRASGHYFTLTAAGINKLKNIKTKTPFCLKVDNQIIYTGFLMPGYLNLTCSGIIIDPISYSPHNTIAVRFKYIKKTPPKIKDLRNDAVLLKTLEEQGKLRK